MKASSVVVLSGGLDSVVLLHNLTKETGSALRAIYFDIGYLSSVPEKNAAKAFCYQLNVPIEIVDVRGIFGMVSGFVPIELLGLGELDKGQPIPIKNKPTSPDKDYVSGFHVILGLASYYAMLGNMGSIHVGIIKEQIQYSKGLKSFLKDWPSTVAKLNPHRPFTLEAPFADKSKSEVIQLGMDLSIDISRTWSCYRSGPLHCGVCNGCASRKQAFSKATVDDPTAYVV
jgi:7-cyano-7-deazaguanine synthase